MTTDLLPLAIAGTIVSRRYRRRYTGQRRRATGDVARIVTVEWRDAAGTVHTSTVPAGWTRPDAGGAR